MDTTYGICDSADNTIIVMTYSFSGYGIDIKEYRILKETEKLYIVMKDDSREGRISKEEVGKVVCHPSDFCPYLRVFLLNATKLDAKEKLAEWFENKASYIRR